MFVVASSVLACTQCAFSMDIENTFDIVMREATRQLREIADSVPVPQTPPLNLNLVVAGHPDRAWLEVQAVRAIEQRTDIRIVDSTADNSLEIVAVDLSTRYNKTENADTVERIVTVALEGLYKGQEQKWLSPKKTVVRERCLRTDALREQSTQLTSSYASLPEAERSFFEEIIEPVIFVAAAVITVVLAFTIRSK